MKMSVIQIWAVIQNVRQLFQIPKYVWTDKSSYLKGTKPERRRHMPPRMDAAISVSHDVVDYENYIFIRTKLYPWNQWLLATVFFLYNYLEYDVLDSSCVFFLCKFKFKVPYYTLYFLRRYISTCGIECFVELLVSISLVEYHHSSMDIALVSWTADHNVSFIYCDYFLKVIHFWFRLFFILTECIM